MKIKTAMSAKDKLCWTIGYMVFLGMILACGDE